MREASWPTAGGEPRFSNVQVTPTVDAESDAMNRRGRQIRLRVPCVSIGTAEHGSCIIILMQEIARVEPAPTDAPLNDR